MHLRKPTMPVSWIPFKQIQTESRNADSNFSLIEKLLKPWSWDACNANSWKWSAYKVGRRTKKSGNFESDKIPLDRKLKKKLACFSWGSNHSGCSEKWKARPGTFCNTWWTRMNDSKASRFYKIKRKGMSPKGNLVWATIHLRKETVRITLQRSKMVCESTEQILSGIAWPIIWSLFYSS